MTLSYCHQLALRSQIAQASSSLKITPSPNLSRLAWPNGIRQLPHQFQLGHHIVPRHTIPQMVTRKSTLRTHPDPPQRLLPRLARAGSDKVGRLKNPLAHLVEVLELGELARNDAQHDVLVRRQLLERLEAARTLRVVLEKVRVDVDLVEELAGDAVVAAFAKVPAVGKVAAAEVQADVEIVWAALEAVVVELNVAVQQGFRVLACVFETLEHLFGAEV